MKGFYSLIAGSLLGAATLLPAPASAIGWPENYQGVMLQGFYWDSYDDTKWTKLESQADELSKYFSLIWIPNSGKCGFMGYMPQYWFTNHNSAFGTEEELLSMISTFKKKGTGFIADCVINHRNGVTEWYDFPVEEWNGRTWSIGLDGICGNDEMAYDAGQPNPTGNYDTGDNFDGCRDLDHTNPNVQDNCKNYVLCLKEKYGYVGMRYDMVKGYGGEFNKIYNEYANVEFSVGEYWDSNYDAVAGWINATGNTSAAFDFPCKYAINEAFASGDMRKLVWNADGKTLQPAGMIHWWYPRYSVTFVDNHDTYRDGSKFNGNEVAANAFILFSPGTPCVFLRHYLDHKEEIQRLAALRNEVGIHNQSAVRVLLSDWDCYMAEITGKKGKAVVKVGGKMVSPEGYSNSDIKAVGNDYCVWAKIDGSQQEDTAVPDRLYVTGNVNGTSWSTVDSPEMKKEGNIFTLTATFSNSDPEAEYCLFSLIEKQMPAEGEDNWGTLNNSCNRYGPKLDQTEIADNSSSAFVKFAQGDEAWTCTTWKILPGTYTLTVDFSTMTLSVGERGENDDNNDDDDIVVGMPAKFYILGHADGNDWDYATGVEMTKKGSSFTATVNLAQPPATKANADPYAYFSFAKRLGTSWDDLNVAGNRYAPAVDTEISEQGDTFDLVESATPSSAKAYRIMPGKYDVEVDWSGKKVKISKAGSTGVDAIEAAQTASEPVYFNLQGGRVANPEPGAVYIRVLGGKASKVRY